MSAYYGSTIDGVKIEGSVAFTTLLLEKAHVAMVPGAAFGADAHVRMSYALDIASIKEGLGRVEALLAKADPQPS